MISRFFVTSCCLLLLFSCGIKKNRNAVANSPIKNDHSIVDSTIYRTLYSINKIDSTVLSLHYQFFEFPNEKWQDSINQQIFWAVCETINPANCDPTKMVVSKFFFEWNFESLFQKAKDDYENASYKALWEFNLSFEISYAIKDVVSLGIYTNSYFGRNSSLKLIEFHHFSLLDGHKMELKDFLQINPNLINFSDSLFRVQNQLTPNMDYHEMGFWFQNNTFDFSQNFYFKGDELIFVYNPYEVAPLTFENLKLSVPITLTKQKFR